MMRFWKWSAVVLGMYLLASAIGGLFLCEMAVHPQRRKLPANAQNRATGIANARGAILRAARITSSDGSVLKGWYFTKQGAQRSVVLLHGLTDNRSGMYSYIELFLEDGFNVLAPDSRNHGQSGGGLVTYGLLERNDVQLWMDWLLRNAQSPHVYALGESMGAAILLQSLTVEQRFRAVAAEASFADFQEIGCDRVSQKVGAWFPLSAGRILFIPVVRAGMYQAHRKFQLDFREASPEKAVAVIRTPVLLIHGTNDTNIPYRHGEDIIKYAGGNSKNVTFWSVPDGEHANTVTKHSQEFRSRVLSFFKTH